MNRVNAGCWLRVACLALVGFLLVPPGSAGAQAFPAKPIRWIVPYPPGGSFDIITRALTPSMSTALGQPLVIENQPGAAGTIGLGVLARQPADGYAIATAGPTLMMDNPVLKVKLPYDPGTAFAPIGTIGEFVTVLLVHTSVNVHTLPELIQYSKANPGKLFYGSAGIGHVFQLSTELLKMRTGADLTHVPYKGAGPALQEFLTGRIQVLFYPPSTSVLAQIKAGVVRPLAAATSRRLTQVPDVPTFEEVGIKNVSLSPWLGLVAPAGTPSAVTRRLNYVLNQAIDGKEAAKSFDAQIIQPIPDTPEGMAGRIVNDAKAYESVYKQLGFM